MHPTTAQRLMAIAADAWIAAHVLHLPPSWGTLYLISTLAVAERERLLEAGIIRPDMQRADIEKAIRQLRGSGSTGRTKPVQPVIEPSAQPIKPPVERMLAKQAENAEVEADALAAEEVEATERRCSFCGGAGLDLVSSAAHVAYICWDCAAEAEALLRPRPPSPELQALGDAMFAHRAPGTIKEPWSA
jgi:hypothetical protein